MTKESATPGRPAATIVIPTHDHGATLYASVRSALEQSVPVEVFIVGDGATAETAAIAHELAAGDARVRFFEHPKSTRRGEEYRHAALAEARGEIICYLSDDDVYLPHHAADMCEMLRDADFVHAQTVEALPDGGLAAYLVDLALPAYRQDTLAGMNRIPLSAGAHTMQAYRSLAVGWSSAPADVPSDLFMWQKFIRHPGCRFRAGWRPSVVVFPSPKRWHLTNQERLRELERWTEEIRGEAGLTRLMQRSAAARNAEPFSCELQIFFPRRDGYSERESVRIRLWAGEWQIVKARVPCAGGLPVRIDPGRLPGLIEIESLAVRDLHGQILWELTAANAGELRAAGTAVVLDAQVPFIALSHGGDPQILLPRLPASAGEVEVDLKIHLDSDPGRLAALLAGYARAVQSKRVPLRRAVDRLLRRPRKT